MQSDAEEPVVGKTIGDHFLVRERCGHGGYGIGFRCEDLRLPGRQVLVKWGKRADDEVRERFREQARYELAIVSPSRHGRAAGISARRLSRRILCVPPVAKNPLRWLVEAETKRSEPVIVLQKS